jgi:hypothetical protein
MHLNSPRTINDSSTRFSKIAQRNRQRAIHPTRATAAQVEEPYSSRRLIAAFQDCV